MAGDKTITYNTATGSNANSGCGPASAVTGTSAISGDGAGGGTQTVIDLSADTPDLSAVQVGDILFIASGAATDRWLFEITAVDDTADTVTVGDAPTTAINTGSALAWSIGGIRENPFSQYSNDRWGDMYWGHERGWTFELTAGQTFNISAGHTTWPADGGDIPSVLQSTVEGTKATLDVTASISYMRNYRQFIWNDIEFLADGISTSAARWSMENCMFNRCTFDGYPSGTLTIEGCHFNSCKFIDVGSTDGLKQAISVNDRQTNSFNHCMFYNTGSIYAAATDRMRMAVTGCVFVSPTGEAINLSINTSTSTNEDYLQDFLIIGNTFFDVATDAIKVRQAPSTGVRAMSICIVMNNIFSNCGGYAVNFFSSAVSDIRSMTFLNNLFYSNTSGNYSTAGYAGMGDVLGDPLFTSTTSGSEDLTLGAGSPAIDAGLEPPAEV